METNSVHRNWGLAFLCLALIGVGVFLYLQPEKQSLPDKKNFIQTPEVKKTTTLSLTPENILVKKGAETYIAIIVNTNEDLVSAVEIMLSYDPKIIEVVDITEGSFFDNPNVLEKTINQIKGSVTYTIGGLKAKQGEEAIVKLKMKGLKKGKSTLNLEGSQVAAVQKNSSVLKETVPGKIVVE